MHRQLLSLALAGSLALAASAQAFCGFYVAKADTKLFNKASKVVLVRQGERTVITMASDYQGDPKEFAMIVPVPSVITREQVHVTENAIIDHLDAYSSPRLVEYFDEDPCLRRMYAARFSEDAEAPVSVDEKKEKRANALGVTIEDQYTVGEYDILVLSAKESDGLITWLSGEGYKIPKGASSVVASYLKQNTKFFVAKVNLKEHAKQGRTFLRPLAVAFESPKFMLPIRLGTVNSNGDQELFVFALTPMGQVEAVNYRTVKIPSDTDVPLYVKDEFPAFYKSMFETAHKKENDKAVFLEYAWNMNWCDPCAADPLSQQELRELGVFWLPNAAGEPLPWQTGQQQVFLTRLHVRYNAETFPEDLMFQETGDPSNFQGRYVLRHPWKGTEKNCQEAKVYLASLPKRFEQEAQNLANLTGWDISDVRKKMNSNGQTFEPAKPATWYQDLWGK